ncbi:MAG: hypothetical protein JJV98_18735 [Desulfosarcina sp.]|nr:hypothetical protein [Desulfobacterales bacterium]
MPRTCLVLTCLILLVGAGSVPGQDLIYCPTAAEERDRRCARVVKEIAQHQRRIESARDQLRNPDVVLAQVEKPPGESLPDYRARVALQQGVATPQSNSWLPVRGHYYNPDRRQMYVALARDAYWQYIWEGLAFDPALAEATFKRREQRSQREKEFQLTSPDSAVNRERYNLETLAVFRRECCPSADPENPGGLPANGEPEAQPLPAPLPPSDFPTP